MRNWKGLLVLLSVVTLASVAHAEPTIGVYFDADGTQTTFTAPYTSNQGYMNTVTAYIIAAHTEQTVGGAAFKLAVDPKINIVGATYPGGVQVGTLTDGIQIGFTNCYFGYYDSPVLLATLTLNTAMNFMAEAALEIQAYPPANAVQLADCNAEITTAAAGHAALTVYPPTTVGIYWDQAGTQTNLSERGGYDVTHTAYIIAMDTEQTVGGAAFALAMDPRISLTNVTYPAGVQVGNLLNDPAAGVQIGLTNCYMGFYGNPVLLATLNLWTGANLMSDAYLDILPYPPAGVVQLADCNAVIRPVAGGRATLTIPVPTETKSWGQIKSLYNN